MLHGCSKSYRRALMTKCHLQSNFIEIALRHGCSLVKLLHISRTLFPKNTSEGLLLIGVLDVSQQSSNNKISSIQKRAVTVTQTQIKPHFSSNVWKKTTWFLPTVIETWKYLKYCQLKCYRYSTFCHQIFRTNFLSKKSSIHLVYK